MEIKSDIILRGEKWKRALEIMTPFFKQVTQPNFSIFYLSASIGIMYDEQREYIKKSDEDNSIQITVPRTVLNAHNSDMDFLFQSAILTSKKVNLSRRERMSLAFDPSTPINFNKIEFIQKFSNYGIDIFLEHISDNTLETMVSLKNFLECTSNNCNFDIDDIPEPSVSFEDIK